MKSNSLAIILSIGMVIYSGSLFSQKTIKVSNLEESLPKITLNEKSPQKYLMVVENKDYDLYGNFKRKNRITGEYTRALKNESVKWNNVRIAKSQKFDESFPEGEKQNYMEDFSYGASEDMLKESFFRNIPEIDVHTKSLVWNMALFESFAWSYWDELILNLEYSVTRMNSIFKIEGIGTLEHKDVRITWTGITVKNDKLCAIIQFKALSNPLVFNMQNTDIKGRSHYWGNIYVSLADKQIEYGELHQDTVMDIKMNDQESGSKFNTIINISLEKIH